MAEKQSTLTYEGIMKELVGGNFRPVYLLVGEESYFIDRIAEYIEKHAIKEEERDFNQRVVYGIDSSPAQIMDSARALPMMAKYQVIIVREAQLMRGIEQLEKYFKKPVPSTILVVCFKKEMPKSKKGWIAEAEKNGICFESKKLRDSALPLFVAQYLKQKGAEIEQKAAMMVAESIGSDLSRITSELDKIFISLPEKQRRITPEIVEEFIGISKDYNIFELRDAIARKDVLKANRIVKYFDKNPKSGNLHSLVPQLFSFFQNMMAAYYCPNRNREDELAAWLGLRGSWAAREYVSAMRLYNPTKVMYIIQKLRTIAAKSNGLDNKNTTEGELMQELVFFILH